MHVSSAHDPGQWFRRLESTSCLIARHPDFPGKAEAIRSCREDVEQRFVQGMLTGEQRARLLAILDGEVLRDGTRS